MGQKLTLIPINKLYILPYQFFSLTRRAWYDNFIDVNVSLTTRVWKKGEGMQPDNRIEYWSCFQWCSFKLLGFLTEAFSVVYICRCGRFPPVVRTAVPVDGRFEHIVISCNTTKDHEIVWIEKEAQRALEVSFRTSPFSVCSLLYFFESLSNISEEMIFFTPLIIAYIYLKLHSPPTSSFTYCCGYFKLVA